MYLSFWNLREPPFQNVADPRFAYLCEQHHEGLARLVYLVQNRKLGGILAGPYGIGKSMVMELLSQEVRRDNSSLFIGFDYLPGKPMSLVRQILALMGYGEQAQSIGEPFEAVCFLRQHSADLKHTVLAIDEAQYIADPEVYSFLQLLTNITIADRQHGLSPAFTLILAGASELHQSIVAKESLRQRLQIIWNLEPLNEKQVVEYVQHRIRVAGGDIWLFDSAALAELAPAGGLPRLINNICDVALMLGFAANVRQVNHTIMRQAFQETCAKGAGSAPSPAG